MAVSDNPTRRYDVDELWDVVAAVARVANPDDPGAVSQRLFDKTKAKVGYGDAPDARHIARTLKHGWAPLLARALDSKQSNRALVYGQRAGEEAGRKITAKEAAGWLQAIARRVPDETVTRDVYARERAVVLKRAGDHPLDIPTAEAVSRALGGWDGALEGVGLSARNPGKHYRATRPLKVLVRCVEAHGAEPLSRELVTFAAANDIRLARLAKAGESGKEWKTYYIPRFRRLWARLGRWAPPGPPPRGQQPDFSKKVDEQHLLGLVLGRKQREHSREAVIDALVAFYRENVYTDRPKYKRITQRAYAAWVKRERAEGRERPYPTSVAKHGSLFELAAEARRRLGRDG